jgi:lysophospholipase L1-like esterase
MGWQRYVAVGDSFTEGLDDPYPQGGMFRGWADLVASRLAEQVGPGFGYANLAVRGRLFGPVVTGQVPAALALKPDLVSFAAGGNDLLRRHCDPHALVARFDTVIGDIRATGADVVIFRFVDVSARLPGQRVIGPRVAVVNRGVGEIAERHGARLVDLWADDEFANPMLFAADRLHLSAAGHRRVAAHVLTALGAAPDQSWFTAPARPVPAPWLLARREDLRWAGQHLAPWVKRRLTGRSSGDNVLPKRPALAPVSLLDSPMAD